MADVKKIVIIGGGQAAASAINKLRANGYEGALTLVTDENSLPYQRPPLSKKYLMGEMASEDLLLRPESFYKDNNVTCLTGTKATRLDAEAQTVELDNGTSLEWDRLLLATGSSPRLLPEKLITGNPARYAVRSITHVDLISPLFSAGHRVLIIGGGYIGLEAAAVARKCGLETTLVEAAPRILQRVAAEETSAYFRHLHQEKGVDLREGVGLVELAETADGKCLATLDNGEEIEADFAIIGIGIAPGDELAESAGLTINNGIFVDDHARTSNPNIYAAGDCASFMRDGQVIRLESVQNANDQAEIAALNMLGGDETYTPVPWFWSDQYDVKLQIAGLNTGFDTIIERPGSREGGKSHWYFKEDQFLAVDAFNDGAAFMCGKRFLETNSLPSPDQMRDLEKPLKVLMKELTR